MNWYAFQFLVIMFKTLRVIFLPIHFFYSNSFRRLPSTINHYSLCCLFRNWCTSCRGNVLFYRSIVSLYFYLFPINRMNLKPKYYILHFFGFQPIPINRMRKRSSNILTYLYFIFWNCRDLNNHESRTVFEKMAESWEFKLCFSWITCFFAK